MDLNKKLKLILKDFRLQVALTLFLVWIISVLHFRSFNTFLYPLIAITTVTLLDLSITFVRDHKIYLPFSSLVTGFLIGLIISPAEKMWIIAVAALFAVISKQFINIGLRRHIFNPATFGIMTVALLSSTPVAWWAVSWSRLPLIILIPLMTWILWRLKRIYLPIGFLIVYFLYLLTKLGLPIAVSSIIDGSVLLFALIMLPEPITSPATGYFKYLFGPIVALISIILSTLKITADVFLSALLLGNLLSFLLLKLKSRKKSATTQQN